MRKAKQTVTHALIFSNPIRDRAAQNELKMEKKIDPLRKIHYYINQNTVSATF